VQGREKLDEKAAQRLECEVDGREAMEMKQRCEELTKAARALLEFLSGLQYAFKGRKGVVGEGGRGRDEEDEGTRTGS
jgi:hypothetical protein